MESHKNVFFFSNEKSYCPKSIFYDMHVVGVLTFYFHLPHPDNGEKGNTQTNLGTRQKKANGELCYLFQPQGSTMTLTLFE